MIETGTIDYLYGTYSNEKVVKEDMVSIERRERERVKSNVRSNEMQ